MSMNANLSYFMSRMQGVSTNVFRLEPQNSSTATPNQQIRFNLPSNALLNTRSIMLMFNATTSGTTAGARLPPKIESLITRYELQAGGVQISQGFDLYNVLVHAKSALLGSKTDSVLGHPEMVRAKSYVNGSTIATTGNEVYADANGATQFGVCGFEGVLGSIQPSVLDTSLMPDLVLIFHLAGTEVLSSVAGITFSGTGGSDIDDDGAGGASYTLNNIRLNCEVIGLASAVYDELIARRISDVGYIELPFKSYQSFQDSHTGATKFSISCQSLDRIWVVQRTAAFDTQGGAVPIAGYKIKGGFVGTAAATESAVTLDLGVPQYDAGGVLKTNGEKYTTKFFNMTLNESAAPAKFQLQMNGSYFPQTQMNVEEMYAITKNSVDHYAAEFMTLDQYRKNYFVQCFRFCLPDSGVREISGTDTRGINLACSYNTSGITNGSNVVVFAEHTSSLRVGANRSIEIIL